MKTKTKINFLSLISLAVVMLFSLGSCSNEDAGSDTGNTQSLVIKLPYSVAGNSRVVDEQWANTESGVLNNARVFLLSGDAVIQTGAIAAGSNSRTFEQVPGNINRVIVVANYASATDATLALETSGTSIKRFFDVASQNDVKDKTMKTLMGDQQGLGTAATALDGHKLYTVSMSLEAITARMEVGTVICGTGVEEVELIGVWVNQFYNNSNQTDLKYYEYQNSIWNLASGYAAGTSSSAYSITSPYMAIPYVPAEYQNDANDDVKAIVDSKAYAFHVFSGNVPHLILLVKGKYEAGYSPGGDNNLYFLKWVTFTKFIESGGTAITSMGGNLIYKIGVVKTGGTGGGTGDPGIVIDAEDLTDEPETQPFDLEINVTVTDWTSKYVTPSV